MGKKEKKKQSKVSAKAPVIQQPKKKKENFLLLWLVLAGITIVCFIPMLKNGFTNWDDEFYVVNNPMLHGPDWGAIFSQPVVSNYHPLTMITLAINYAISGTDAWSYLLLNLILHVVNVILVFKFIYSISDKKKWIAFFTALIFAIHPMHVESVAWASERKDVLYTLFFLISLMQYWKFLQTGKQKGIWLCFLFFVLSLLSKPAAIVLPLVLFLLDYWKQRQFNKKLLFEKIPFFLIAILFTVITLKLQSVTAIKSLDVYPIWVRLFFACYVTMIYFIRFFVPYPLSSFHPFPSPSDLGWAVYASPLFILVMSFALWYFRKTRIILFGALFFLVNILLVLQLIPIGYTIVSERYTYVPYIGLGFLFVMLINKYVNQKSIVPVRIIAVIAFAIFGFVCFQRTEVWKDSNTLWSDVIKKFSDASLPHRDRAQYNYNRAILMDPTQATSLFKDVIEDCTVAINTDTDSASNPAAKGGRSMYYMRANAYNSLKQYDSALADFNDCILIDSNDHEVLYLRGALLVNHFKNYTEALSDFNRAIQIDPQGRYYLNRSICYYKMGDIQNAKADAQTAIQKGVMLPENYKQALNL